MLPHYLQMAMAFILHLKQSPADMRLIYRRQKTNKNCSMNIYMYFMSTIFQYGKNGENASYDQMCTNHYSRCEAIFLTLIIHASGLRLVDSTAQSMCDKNV